MAKDKDKVAQSWVMSSANGSELLPACLSHLRGLPSKLSYAHHPPRSSHRSPATVAQREKRNIVIGSNNFRTPNISAGG
jgi:hypothetical protein